MLLTNFCTNIFWLLVIFVAITDIVITTLSFEVWPLWDSWSYATSYVASVRFLLYILTAAGSFNWFRRWWVFPSLCDNG